MGFASLLGNERLKEHLHNAFAGGRASHFYLISGPEGAGKGHLAKLLAQAFLCEGEQRPCGVCPACRKVRDLVHPDVIWVTDPDHKNVPVKQIRQVRDDLFVRPNEGRHKVYILPQALGVEGQNALLKVLEEPPQYGVFLVLTDNPETVLPTVRSRCVELKLQALPRQILLPTLQKEFPQAGQAQWEAACSRSGGYLGQARKLLAENEAPDPKTAAFVRAFAAHDPLELTQIFAQMERMNREQLQNLLNQWVTILHDALLCRAGVPAGSAESQLLAAAQSAAQLNHGIALLQQAVQYAQGNVAPGAICGWLAQTL